MRFLAHLVAAATALAAAPVLAAPPAAIVEEAPAGLAVQPMDYLTEGQTIALQPGQRLVIGYLESCTVETVTGGRVVVGKAESRVEGGKVERKTIGCEGDRLVLAPGQAGKSGAMVYRKPPQPGGRVQLPRADVVVRAQSPVLALNAGGSSKVTLERLDRDAPVQAFEVPGRLDLAKAGIRLPPGALYRARAASGATVVFMIDPDAGAEAGPILARLVPM